MSLRRSFRRLNKKSKKRLIRFSIVTANLLLVIAVGTVVAKTPDDSINSYQSARTASSELPLNDGAQPLDTLSSTDVAVHVARLVRMEESTAVVNKADTASAQLAVASSDDQVLAKPQIVTTALKSKKDITTYITVEGDTVSSVASKFGITPDTIRYSNGLTGEDLTVGKELTISPVNGMTYVVKAGDTPDSLAAKYNVPKDQLIAFNDAEISGVFTLGELIVIPDAVQPAEVRTASYGSMRATYGGNGYDYGWCTWHAANRRIQTGSPIPTNLGNAISWLSIARRAGLPTGDVPKDGAVLYHKDIGGLGHVAYVEKVNPDGSALVSDMNYPTWGKVTYRTIQPGDYSRYSFIY